MPERMRNVLFLCTGNSARSILAEALLNHWGKDNFKGYSAGSFPKGDVHPLALETLTRLGLSTTGYRSKSWSEFAEPGAPHMDYILTVCDQAAGELCPVWPGHPITAHWGVPDPAAVHGTREEQLAAFRETAHILQLRIQYFLTFRFKEMRRADLQKQLAEAGKLTSNTLV